MLQLTALRTPTSAGFARPIIVANARHADLIEEQLGAVGCEEMTLILEPAGRNTAPAIALAALAASDPASPILVMPSDHVINDVAAFHDALRAAAPLVADGWLVTFGITPDAPETGYGYIRMGEEIAPGVHAVRRFVEKPDIRSARAMLASGDHAWNAGIFLFRADRYLEALGTNAPEMLHAAQEAMEKAERLGGRILPDADAFMASPSDSIDYAVMEGADRVAVVPVSMGWSDVGSWSALHAICPQDVNGNHVRGKVNLLDSAGNLVRTDGARVSLVGVHDLIVVVDNGEVLILPKDRAQDIKKLLELVASD